MNLVSIIIIVGIAATLCIIAPRLAAITILAAVGRFTRKHSADIAAAFAARSLQAADAWGETSKSDQDLLARSLRTAMTRTSLGSQHPSHAF